MNGLRAGNYGAARIAGGLAEILLRAALALAAVGMLTASVSFAGTRISLPYDSLVISAESEQFVLDIRTVSDSSGDYLLFNGTNAVCSVFDLMEKELARLAPGEAIDLRALGVPHVSLGFFGLRHLAFLDLRLGNRATIKIPSRAIGGEMVP